MATDTTHETPQYIDAEELGARLRTEIARIYGAPYDVIYDALGLSTLSDERWGLHDLVDDFRGVEFRSARPVPSARGPEQFDA